MKQLKILALLSAASMFTPIHGVTQITQSSSVTDLTRTVSAKAFDKYNGTFYIGTTGGDGIAPTYSIALAGRTDTSFTPIAPAASPATGIEIGSLALVNNDALAASHLAYSPMAYTFIATGTLLNAVVLSDANYVTTGLTYALTGTGVGAATLPANFDLLAGSTNYVFARVHPFPGISLYDGIGSGISAAYFNGTNAPQSMGNAVQWNSFKGVAGNGSPLLFASADSVMTGSPHVNDMYWDPYMPYKDGSTTYYGTLFITGTVPARFNGADMFSAITTATIRTGQLALRDVLPNGVTPLVDTYNHIFAHQPGAATNATIILKKIRTMHTSTNKYYLIVNGGVENVDGGLKCGNEVYALRYSDTLGFVTQNDPAGTGLINNFTNAHLYGSSTISLTVGGGPAPWPNTQYASDMEVIGDTVYVSCTGTRGATLDPGVWASQALFNGSGIIVGWTKWERVTPSLGATVLDATHFFSPDASTGKFWINTEESTGNLPKKVYRTVWDTAAFGGADTLPGKLTTDLSDGCFCALDLTAGTTFLGTNASPYASIALFGGYEKAVIARTATGVANATVIDFSSSANYLKTLLTGFGCVRCLGYSKYWTDPTKTITTTGGYFLAGCDQGLYAYANQTTHAGFNTEATGGITDLNTTIPTASFSWQRVAANTIVGSVTHIEGFGDHIYVVERDLTVKNSNICRIWVLDIGNTIADMESTIVKIAESGSAGLPANSIITGFKLVTNNIGSTVRIVVSTNEGIYTLADIGSSWVAVEDDNAYNAIFAPKFAPTPATPTYWGINPKIFGIHFADGSEAHQYYQNSKLDLLSFPFDTASTSTTITPYTNNSMASGTNTLTYLDRSLTLYTDGGRRIYTRFNPNETAYNAINVLPFEAAPWNMTSAYTPTELTSVPRAYWIENISGNGKLLAGTDTGVIALE